MHVLIAGALTLVAVTCLARALWVHRHPCKPGRHELREQAAEREADDFITDLRGLPRPGLDMYSDQTVHLPVPPAERCVCLTSPEGPNWCLARKHLEGPLPARKAAAERLLSDTDVRAVTPTCPAGPGPHLPAPAPGGSSTGRHTAKPGENRDHTGRPGTLPAWVVEALGGHHGVDACVESIVARAAGQ